MAEAAPPPQKKGRIEQCEAQVKIPTGYGAIEILKGTWETPNQGWNMIAVPFKGLPSPNNFRVLMNQYKETLTFTEVADAVANRGIKLPPAAGLANSENPDQFVATLDYEQKIAQIAVADFPRTDEQTHGGIPLDIHHEAGLWLNMHDNTTDGINIARLSTIPHGNSVLALGAARTIEDPKEIAAFTIPPLSGMPIGVDNQCLRNVSDLIADPSLPPKEYLDAYAFFHKETGKPFFGTVDPKTVNGFPGFDSINPTEILSFALNGLKARGIKKIHVLPVNTNNATAASSGGINNIPFGKKQADATSMTSTFWVYEFESGPPVLQYAQSVMIDFFPRKDGQPGKIQWPHVSINTMTLKGDDDSSGGGGGSK